MSYQCRNCGGLTLEGAEKFQAWGYGGKWCNCENPLRSVMPEQSQYENLGPFFRCEKHRSCLKEPCPWCKIDHLTASLAAADRLAHQYPHSPFHEDYWRARGHDKCTVCVATLGAKGFPEASISNSVEASVPRELPPHKHDFSYNGGARCDCGMWKTDWEIGK